MLLPGLATSGAPGHHHLEENCRRLHLYLDLIYSGSFKIVCSAGIFASCKSEPVFTALFPSRPLGTFSRPLLLKAA